MPLDASIPLQAQAPQPIDPLAVAIKGFTLKQAMTQAQLGDMELKDNLTLRDAFKDPTSRNPDGTINYQNILSNVGGKVSPKVITTLTTASQAQEEKKRKMMEEYFKAAGPVAAGLFTKYQDLSKQVGPDQAWSQVGPQAKQALEQLKQQFPGAPIKNEDMTPQMLEQGAMHWDKYVERTMRGSQPKTPHEVATEETAQRGASARERSARAAEERAKATKGFEGENGELMGAMAERGISLPAGFRSKEQQVGLLSALRKRNPGKSVDEIADMVKNGQIDLANVKKAGQVAAGIAGKVSYAEKEIEQTIPLVREASAKLPRGQFIPFNKLKQMGDEAFSNPDLAEFRMYMTSLSNAYDMLAARGGTDKDKRAENRKNFETAQSPEALERVLQAVRREAQVSGKAAQESMKPPGSGSSGDSDKKRRPLSEFFGG